LRNLPTDFHSDWANLQSRQQCIGFLPIPTPTLASIIIIFWVWTQGLLNSPASQVLYHYVVPSTHCFRECFLTME
jgi:hypothetical protein